MAKLVTRLGLVVLLCAIAQAQATFTRDFSADSVSHSAGRETDGRFYVSKGRIRMETLRNGVVKGVMIMDPRSKTLWEIMPERNVAMNMSRMYASMLSSKDLMQKPVDAKNPCATLTGYTCHKLGAETVNGRQTEKWELTEPNGKATYLWVDPTIPLAIKTQTDQYTGEFRNIKEGPQPESLFTVPPDYRKVGGPGQGR